MRRSVPNRRYRGFSLLEVLIAVVVLAIGLLALAALQGSLASSSADAKVRGRVAAMLTTRMDDLRNAGYGTLTDGGPTTVTSTTGDCDPATPDATDWIDCARIQAGLANLSASQTITTWSGTAGFAAGAAAAPTVPQFKRVLLTASWSEADASNHQLSVASDVSALALTSNVVVPPDPQGAGGFAPIVRTVDPATAGMIPIALDSSSTSAASNPLPELIGRKNNEQIVGTQFTTLNYTPPVNSEVVVQKRFENEVIKCSCKYGAGGNNLPEIYRTAQWPAIWTGERYDIYKPSTATDAPGQAASSGQTPGVQQSPLCQECCRDHHDNSDTGVAKFDPERSDNSTAKYDFNGTSLVPAPANGTYVDACRVIRVDGFWRTAADMYSRQLGLLETETVGDQAAKSGVPTANAATAYTNFVKNYLKQYDGTTATAPGNAATMFDGTSGINTPAVVTIPAVSNTDFRYLHARGLYVDYLEEKARTRLTEVLADNGPQGQCPSGTNLEDCVLTHLPFTSVNLTEIAKWLASDPNVLTVNSGNLLPNPADSSQAPDPTKPSGSRTIGKAVGAANNTATMRKSNSGVAVNAVLATLNGVDPGDDTDVASDTQPFQVNGSANSGPTFDVSVTGGGLNPFVFFSIASDVDKTCLKPAGSNYHCVTSTGTVLPLAGAIRISNYWLETTTVRPIAAGTCTGQNGTINVDWPTFRNFAVTAANINGLSGTVGAPVSDAKYTESTTVSFTVVSANDLVQVTLAEEAGSPVYATIVSCTTKANGSQIKDIVWNKPWTVP
jgi:type IV pilus modification protein PilV